MKKIVSFIALLILALNAFSQKESDEKVKRKDYPNYLRLFYKIQNQESNIFDSITHYNKNVETVTGKAFAHLLFGYYYFNNNINKADSSFKIAKQYFIKVEDEKGIANTNFTLANIAMSRADYQKALNNYLEALELEFIKNDSVQTARVYNNIGAVFFSMGDFKKSKKYYNRALKVFNDNQLYKNQIIALTKLGDIEIENKDLNKADSIYQKVLKVAIVNKDTVAIAEGYANIADVQIEKNQTLKAISNYKNALILLKNKPEYQNNVALINIGLGDCYTKQNNYKTAKKYYSDALLFYNNNNMQYIFNTLYPKIINVEGQLKNYKQAFEYQKKYQTILDSIYTVEKITAIEDVEAKYQTEKKEKELLVKQNQILQKDQQLAQQKNKNKLFILGLLATVSLLIIIAYFYYKKNKLNKKLVELNNFKSQVFKVIGHDLRSPIANIVMSDNNPKTIAKAQNALGVLDELLVWGNTNISIKQNVNVGQLINEIEDEIIDQIENKQLNININSSANQIKTNKDELIIILRNLINNAVKYSVPHSTININITNNLISIKNPIDKTQKSGTKKGLEIVKFLAKKNNYIFNTQISDQFIAKLIIA